MGEKVHTEVHHSQHVKYAQRSYHPAIKVNNHFIIEDKRINGREPLDQAGRDYVEPQRLQTMTIIILLQRMVQEVKESQWNK